MNILHGIIKEVRPFDHLTEVVTTINNVPVTSVIIGAWKHKSSLIIGKAIRVLFKETEVIISKDLKTPISVTNRIPSSIESIEEGPLFSKVRMNSQAGPIVALIPSKMTASIPLRKGDDVLCCIKMNEIILAE